MQKKSQQKLAKMFLIYTQLMTTAKCLILITSSVRSKERWADWWIDCLQVLTSWAHGSSTVPQTWMNKLLTNRVDRPDCDKSQIPLH